MHKMFLRIRYEKYLFGTPNKTVLRIINKLGDDICIEAALEPIPKERFFTAILNFKFGTTIVSQFLDLRNKRM